MRAYCEVNGMFKFKVKTGFQINGKDGVWTLEDTEEKQPGFLYQQDGIFTLKFQNEQIIHAKVTFVW